MADIIRVVGSYQDIRYHLRAKAGDISEGELQKIADREAAKQFRVERMGRNIGII